MTWEQTEHEINQLIASRDAGFGHWDLPGPVLDSCLRMAYLAGEISGAQTAQRKWEEAFAAGKAER
jgi:hypothetical protein